MGLVVNIGCDIGQSVDPTAIVLAEVTTRPTERPTRETVFTVRLMERLALGTRYQDVADRLIDLLVHVYEHDRELEEQARVEGRIQTYHTRRSLYMDATGVGRPVAEMVMQMVKEALFARDTVVYPLTFTHGRELQKRRNAMGTLGKAYLVNRLQMLSQADPPRLLLPPNHPEAQAMMRELKDYEIHVDQDGHDTYGAFKVGTHDDLVTALGLAVLEDIPDRQAWGL